MRGFVANTDWDWFDFLSRRPDLDEVNFWAPSGKAVSGSIPPGAPFFFKLKRPHNAIGGFGFLGPVTLVPASLAWEAFGEKNGAPDLATMLARIRRYWSRMRRREVSSGRLVDPPIGCRVILQPVFFRPDEWVRLPDDWSRNIVVGKNYDLSRGEGERIWRECLVRAALHHHGASAIQDGEQEAARFGKEVTIRPRLGQGAFRLAVIDSYERACAVTGEHSLPVLDSAHIRPYKQGGEHAVTNGILLRTDLHRLFDRGYVTVTPDYEFRVSEALMDEYDNGRVYYELERRIREEGGRVRLPADSKLWPDREKLAWHGERVFRG